jgi:rare lipoprotein A
VTSAVVAAVLIASAVLAMRPTPAPVAGSPTAATTTAGAEAAPKLTTKSPTRTPEQRANRAQARVSPAPTSAPTSTSPKPPSGGGTVVESGTCGVSYYDEPQPTASGEEFDPEAFTAAHKSLPFDTRVRVTNLANGKSVIVRINDRGPYIDGRCLDLARAPFRAIASLDSGVIDARYEVLG